MVWSCYVWRHQFAKILEDMNVEITGEKRKGLPRKSWEDFIKKDLEQVLRREDAYDRKKWQDRIRAEIANPG